MACRISIPVLGRSISVISLEGELDVAALGDLEEAVKRAWAEVPRKVHIDCSAVTFIDSMGVRALLRALRWLQSEGSAVSFTMNDPTRRVLERVGLDDQMRPIERRNTETR